MSKIIPLLFIGIVLSACAGMPESTPTLEPLATATTSTMSTTTACSPPSTWRIELNRSGGFAGLEESLTLDSTGSLVVQSERPPKNVQKTISQDQVDTITELLVQTCPFEIDQGKGVCADCFVYELNIEMDSRTYAIQVTDVTMTDDLQPLISTLNQLLQTTEETE